MKNFIVGFLLASVIMLAIGFSIWRQQKPDIIVRDKIVKVDSLKVDSLMGVIKYKDDIQSQSDARLVENSRVIGRLTIKGKALTLKLDSLNQAFSNDSNFTTCESLVIAQRCAIVNKDSIINEYEDKNAEFEFNLSVMTDKYNLLDSASRIKDGTIEKLNINIERLNCYDVKMERHRFIAWLFGLKCK